MESYAYYNGTFGKKEEISIPLSDRSIFFGDCVYDAAIGACDRILWENEHIERLLTNTKRLGIYHNYSKKMLSEILREVAVKSCIESYFIYFALSRQSKIRNHSAKNLKETGLLITVEDHKITKNQTSIKLITKEDQRHGLCDIKTTNLLPAVIASTEAENNGADEVVFIRKGYITECAKSNISILKQGRLITHPKSNKILPGITREHLISIASENHINIDERPFTVSELLYADEILVTSTSKLCRTVDQINGKAVGGRDKKLASFLCNELYKEYSSFCTINKNR